MEDDASRGGPQPRRKAKPLVPERLHCLVRRADPGEGLEEVRDRLAHLRVRVEGDSAALVVDEAGWKDASILTPPDLIQDPATQSRLQDVELRLAHCPLQAEQQSVVEVRRVVHTVLV